MKALRIVSGEAPNDTWAIGEISDSESDSDDAENDGPRTSDLEELLSAINKANISLLKISMIIRGSSARDDYNKAATRYRIDSAWDVSHVREKYGAAEKSSRWLVLRMGKAITRRRQYLQYRKDHHGKLLVEFNDADSDKEVSEWSKKSIAYTKDTKDTKDTKYTKATAFFETPQTTVKVTPPASLGSATSYEPTVVGDAAYSKLSVPPHPEMAFESVEFEFGQPFLCPYCCTEQSVRNRKAWK